MRSSNCKHTSPERWMAGPTSIPIHLWFIVLTSATQMVHHLGQILRKDAGYHPVCFSIDVRTVLKPCIVDVGWARTCFCVLENEIIIIWGQAGNPLFWVSHNSEFHSVFSVLSHKIGISHPDFSYLFYYSYYWLWKERLEDVFQCLCWKKPQQCLSANAYSREEAS